MRYINSHYNTLFRFKHRYHISYHIIKTFLVRLLLKGHRCIIIVSLQRHLSYRVQPAGG